MNSWDFIANSNKEGFLNTLPRLPPWGASFPDVSWSEMHIWTIDEELFWNVSRRAFFWGAWRSIPTLSSMGGSGVGWAWTAQSSVGWTEQTQNKGELVTLLCSWVRFCLPCPLTSQVWTLWSTPPGSWGSMIWTEWCYQHPWVPRFKTLI